MFEENENIFPAKPEFITASQGNKMRYLVIGLFLTLIVINFLSESYMFLLELLLVLLVHELGHLCMMHFFKAKSQGMFFTSFLGSLTKSFRFSTSQKELVLINLMGPLPGIIIGCVLYAIALNSSESIYLIELSLLFLVINLLNLIPLDPFDSGRVIETLFFQKSDQKRMIFTLVSSLVVIIIGVIFSFYPLTIFGFLMGFKVRSYQKMNLLHSGLREEDVDYHKEYDQLTNREYWKIRAAFLTNNPRLKEMIPSDYVLWDNERLLVDQVKQLLRIKINTDLSIFSKMMALVFMAILMVVPLALVVFNYELVEWYVLNSKF